MNRMRSSLKTELQIAHLVACVINDYLAQEKYVAALTALDPEVGRFHSASIVAPCGSDWSNELPIAISIRHRAAVRADELIGATL